MNLMVKRTVWIFVFMMVYWVSEGSCLTVAFANFGKNLNGHMLSCWLFLVRKVIKKSCFYMF